MAVSAATRTDDWVWAMTQYQLGAAAQVLLVGTAAALYVGVAHMMSALLADFASSRERLVRICRSAWLAAALVASLTALLDVHPMPALLRHALPQGLLSPFGLLLIPGRALQHASPTTQPAVPRAWRWIGAGIVGAAVSLGLLGAGISLRPV